MEISRSMFKMCTEHRFSLRTLNHSLITYWEKTDKAIVSNQQELSKIAGYEHAGWMGEPNIGTYSEAGCATKVRPIAGWCPEASQHPACSEKHWVQHQAL